MEKERENERNTERKKRATATNKECGEVGKIIQNMWRNTRTLPTSATLLSPPATIMLKLTSGASSGLQCVNA